MKIQLTSETRDILNTLNARGFEAYLVGGSVRDGVMGLPQNDFDITTNATPAEVTRIFPNALPTGLPYGTVTVLCHGIPFQITTFRFDGAYEDGRHPDQIAYATSLKDDLLRRDFTINALACASDGVVIDLVDGLSDIENRCIRCVGDAKKRFAEDQLRKLRAVRFAATLDFYLEDYTQNAILKNPSLSALSKERIQMELNKILLSDRALEAFIFMLNSNLLSEISPAFDRLYEMATHIEKQLSQFNIMYICPKELSLRLALFLLSSRLFNSTPTSKPSFLKWAEQFLQDYKYSNKIKHRVLLLLHTYDDPARKEDAILKALLCQYSLDEMMAIFDFQGCCATACTKGASSTLENIQQNKTRVEHILNANEPYKREHLALSSQMLLAAGYAPRQFGEIYKTLLRYIWQHPEDNEADKLLRHLRKEHFTKGGTSDDA